MLSKGKNLKDISTDENVGWASWNTGVETAADEEVVASPKADFAIGAKVKIGALEEPAAPPASAAAIAAALKAALDPKSQSKPVSKTAPVLAAKKAAKPAAKPATSPVAAADKPATPTATASYAAMSAAPKAVARPLGFSNIGTDVKSNGNASVVKHSAFKPNANVTFAAMVEKELVELERKVAALEVKMFPQTNYDFLKNVLELQDSLEVSDDSVYLFPVINSFEERHANLEKAINDKIFDKAEDLVNIFVTSKADEMKGAEFFVKLDGLKKRYNAVIENYQNHFDGVCNYVERTINHLNNFKKLQKSTIIDVPAHKTMELNLKKAVAEGEQDGDAEYLVTHNKPITQELRSLSESIRLELEEMFRKPFALPSKVAPKAEPKKFSK